MIFTASAFDADASAYISAVNAAGSNVQPFQASAINNFVRNEKQGGRWALYQRLYLPIWANATANAICLKTRISGTFVGGVTHANGFVQGNGTNGYFAMDAGALPSTLGQSNANTHLLTLVKSTSGSTTWVDIGATDANPNARNQIVKVPSSSRWAYVAPTNSDAETVIFGDGIFTGLFIGSCTSTTARNAIRLRTSGASYAISTPAATNALPNVVPYAMGRNSNGTANLFSTSEYGLYGCGLGFSIAQSTLAAESIKTLWETCTGLTLP
jgi:hypothetical protein